MNTSINSISHNGCSVCAAGEEKYTTFHPAHRPKGVYYQYDFRHKDGELFSTVAPTLEQCRQKRDKWMQAKAYKRLFPSTLKKIQDGKRLTKCDMGFQTGHVEPLHVVSISWDYFQLSEMVSTFNNMFETEIQ